MLIQHNCDFCGKEFSIDLQRLKNTIDNLEVLYRGEHASIHKAEEYSSREVDSLGRLLPKGKLVEGNLVRHHTFDAGADVFSAETLVIKSGESALIATGLRIAVPVGYVGLLWSRSGLSSKYSLEVGAGCIDSGYTGEVKVHLYNHGINDYKVNIGDSIAQLLTIEVNLHTYEKVDNFDKITTRGDGGFGSTDRIQDDLLGR